MKPNKVVKYISPVKLSETQYAIGYILRADNSFVRYLYHWGKLN